MEARIEARWLAFATLLLLLAACAPQGGPPDRSQFFTGTEGIQIEFLNDAPPRDVYEGTELPLIVRVHNKGAFDVPLRFSTLSDTTERRSHYASISVSHDNYYFQKVEDSALEARLKKIELRGKSDAVPSGEERMMKVADLQAREVAGQIHSPESQVSVSVCYPYITRLSADICMDSTSQSRNLREQVCRARDLSFGRGQGAPVAVERVEVDMVPVGQTIRPSFVIHVRNRGDGSVLRWFNRESDFEDLCSLRGSSGDVNTVWAQVDLAGVELDCSPEPFRLRGDESKLFCTVPSSELTERRDLFGQQDNFVTSLNVELMYVYSSTASRNIEVKRSEGNLLGDAQEESGECRPGQKMEDGECVDLCGETEGTMGYSCSCSLEECTDLLEENGQCQEVGRDLCGNPGTYCCLPYECSDFDDDRNSCESWNDALGCKYCEGSGSCVTDCDDCRGDVEDEGSVCAEIQEEGEDE